MNILIYVILAVIFTPNLFLLLSGKSYSRPTLREALINATLFVIAITIAEYLTHKYHIFENYTSCDSKKNT